MEHKHGDISCGLMLIQLFRSPSHGLPSLARKTQQRIFRVHLLKESSTYYHYYYFIIQPCCSERKLQVKGATASRNRNPIVASCATTVLHRPRYDINTIFFTTRSIIFLMFASSQIISYFIYYYFKFWFVLSYFAAFDLALVQTC